MEPLNSDIHRNWDDDWRQLNLTIDQKDVWLLTDQIKLRYLMKKVPQGPIAALEVGCGSAKLSVLLAEHGVRTVGLDQSPYALRVAKNNFAYLNAAGHFVMGDVFDLPHPSGKFDLVFSTGLLEHFRDPRPIISEMVRVLRPGGLFFSDIVPLKFSLLRAGFYLRGYHKQVKDEFPYGVEDITVWLKGCGLENVQVFSSGVVPSLVLLRRIPLIRDLSFRLVNNWTTFDGTFISDWLGFFYLAFATKP
jgi:SAM-dependent methyltransferase